MTQELLTNFYFSVAIDGAGTGMDAAFQEVSGLSKEVKTEELACGGENRFKFRVPSGTSFTNLILKRGVLSTGSKLLTWCAKTLDGGLSEPIKPKNLQVNLLNADGDTCMHWNFVSAYPVKWSASDLKSQDSSLFIETLEFAYQYFDVAEPT